MFFTLKELVKWLGLTAMEIWLHLLSLLVFSLLLVLKYHSVLTSSWWIIFCPLFVCDGLCAYFAIIVFIRQYKEKDLRVAALRIALSFVTVVCLFVCKFLLCERLTEHSKYSHAEIFAAIFVLLQVLVFRACRVN